MPFSWNVNLVGYHDLASRPGFKLALQEVDGRWYLYMGHLWHSGWSVLDVTDPHAPELVRWISGPPNTWTLQIQVADGLMVTSMEPVAAGWGGDPNGPAAEEGILVWDVKDPREPIRLGHWRSGANGTHRNYYDGGRYVHVTTGLPGFSGRVYAVIDVADPTHPKEVGRWWWPGQHHAAGERFSPGDEKKLISLHGAPYVKGSRAYLPYAGAGMVILDVTDVRAPRLAGHLGVQPPFGSRIAVHTIVPLPDKNLAIINSEALNERCDEPLNFTGIVDVSNGANPRLISLFPIPEPPEGFPVADFADKGGRFGPHNQHQPQHMACLKPSDHHVYMTYFNAGVQIFDISNPRLPRIAGYYIPADPPTRLGPLPRELVVQTEDIIVDRRGYIYVTEKNSGLYVLEFKG